MKPWIALLVVPALSLWMGASSFADTDGDTATQLAAVSQPTWHAVDSGGAVIAEVYFLHTEALLHPSHYATPYVLLDVTTGITPARAGLYTVPIAAKGYTNVDGVGSPIGNAFAYATPDCSDTPVVDTRVIPRLRSTRAGTHAGFVIPIATPPDQSRRHQLWRPVAGSVDFPLVAQRFEVDGPCFDWAPYVGEEDEAYLSKVHFDAVLPPLDDPIRFETIPPPASYAD